MTDKEAMHKLEFMRNAYQKLIDEKVNFGVLVGTDVTGTWKAETPFDDACQNIIESLTLAIAALDKQIPRRKLEKYQYNENLFTLRCPTCGNLIGSYNKRPSRFSYRVLKNENYCCICGQAIDYSEPQEEDLDG